MNPKKQIYIISAILGFIIFGVIIGNIYPLARSIKKDYSSLISQKQELILLKIKAENLVKFQEQYLIFHENLDKIDKVFIDPETPIDFLALLEDIAYGSQVAIEVSIGSAKEDEKALWPSLSFQIITKGPSSNIFRFLEKIENSPYLTEIENLSMKRLSVDDVESKSFKGLSLGDLKVSLLAKVYTK